MKQVKSMDLQRKMAQYFMSLNIKPYQNLVDRNIYGTMMSVSKNDKFAYLNTKFKVVIPYKYDYGLEEAEAKLIKKLKKTK